MKTIVAVDDEIAALDLIRHALEGPDRKVFTYDQPDQALAAMENHGADLILCDLYMPGMDGIELLKRCHVRFPDAKIVILTGVGGIKEAVAAMKAGASDFFTKPLKTQELAKIVTSVLELQEASRSARSERSSPESGAAALPSGMGSLATSARAVAATDSTVLITGETGSGKEVLADFIQRASARAKMPYIKVNCASLPESLIESELFGHEKGAFTGASERRTGRFERAMRGTIFLDEIAELPLLLQAKLLRVLQSHEIERVGGDSPVKVDFRLLCATHRDIPAMVRQGTFREDLFYRINVFPLRVPSLRERPREILALAQEFLGRAKNTIRKSALSLSPEAEKTLLAYGWPGNVRELEHVIERAAIMAAGTQLTPQDFWWLAEQPAAAAQHAAQAQPEPSSAGGSKNGPPSGDLPPLGNPLEEAERKALIETLEKCRWNYTKAAQALGVSRSTLYAKATRCGIRRN
jgi:DNA-binding NtrC family response regulator